jgi:hypothetical protein
MMGIRYTKTFEIWVKEGLYVSVCQAGPAGDQCRSMHEPGTELVHVFDARSELDHMQQYYDHVGFGTYQSPWPELAIRPFHFVDALENLGKLKKPLKPLHEIAVMADGSTSPVIPDPLPRIVVQDRAVFAVDVWIRGDHGGHGEAPINEADLIKLAEAHLDREAPELLQRVSSTFLICPSEIAGLMQWPAAGRDPAMQREPTP